jgi:hypothetical protein
MALKNSSFDLRSSKCEAAQFQCGAYDGNVQTVLIDAGRTRHDADIGKLESSWF